MATVVAAPAGQSYLTASRRRLRQIIRLGLLLGLIAACGKDPQTDRGAVQRRDSAGIVIIETPSSAARASIGWTVDQVPELQLGSAAGEESEYLFDGIDGRYRGGITGFPDGRTVVVNAGSGELLFFDREGRLLNRMGIKGDGPGEFRRPPILVPYASNDSLLIRQANHRRYTLFSSDGQSHRSFMPDRPGVIFGRMGGASETGILLTTLDALPMVEGQHTRPNVVRWINVQSGRADTVARFNTHSYLVESLGGIPYELRVPFTTRPSASVADQGFFVIRPDAPDIWAFDNSGRLIRIFRVIEPPRPTTGEDVEGAIDSLVARFSTVRSEARRVYERMDIPSRWPTFQSVRVDRLGWIWVELFRPPHHLRPQWMVFDSSGVARGVLELPPGLEVHDIGPDYVLGRWLDDLRVEYIRRYRLDRSR